MAGKSTQNFAMITGASQGLGKNFALELAKLKYNTILVSLPGEKVEKVAHQCRESGTESVTYETDLTVKSNLLELTSWVNKNYNLEILINNAGLGGTRSFVESDLDYIDNIIQLNITALTLITHQLLPNLLQRKNGYILNVSSMASFSPFAYKTVYPASKNFVRSFSLGLNQELKESNVFVCVVHPGPMKTNISVTKRIEGHGLFARMAILTPEIVAKRTIQMLLKKKSPILLGWKNKLNWLLMVFTPQWLRLPVLTRAVKREILSKQNKPV